MSDEKDPKEDPGEQIKQGIGLLWKAATGVATNIKKEMERSGVSKTLDDAGREFARAATNVVERIATEINPKRPSSPPPPTEHATDAPAESKPADGGNDGEDDDFDGVKVPEKKPAGPTASDPGFRIAVDDDEPKKG